MDISGFLAKNAGAIAGGLFGAASSSGGGKANETTVNKDPWAAAQPYMLQSMKDQADLNEYYKKNPFNAQQQAGYNNTFADADHFRSSVAPGLLGFANSATTGSYDRQRGGAPGSGAGYGGAVRAGGLLHGAGGGPFSVSPGNQVFGQVDFAKANPFTNGAIPAPKAAEPAATQNYGGLLNGVGGGSGRQGGGHGGTEFGGVDYGGIGTGEYTDAINQKAMDAAMEAGLMGGPAAGIVAGLISMGMSQSDALEAVNGGGDPIGLLNALQKWTANDTSYDPYNATPYNGGGGGGNSGMNGGNGFGNAPPSHPDARNYSGGGDF